MHRNIPLLGGVRRLQRLQEASVSGAENIFGNRHFPIDTRTDAFYYL